MSEWKEKLYPIAYMIFLLFAIYAVYLTFRLGFEKGEYTGRYAPLAEERAGRVEQKPPADLRKLRISAPEQVDLGRELFQLNCASCHGPGGTGDGPKAVGLNPPPRNFRTENFKFGASALQIYNTLSKGSPGTSMAAFDFLPAEDRMALAHYIRTLVPEPPADPQELVDALPVVEGGEPAAAAQADSTAAAAQAPAAGPEIPLALALRRLIAQHIPAPVPAAGAALAGPYEVYCANCHGGRSEGAVVARSFPHTGTLYVQTLPLNIADKRILGSLQSFTDFLAAGMPGVEGHRFAELTALQAGLIFETLKALQTSGK